MLSVRKELFLAIAMVGGWCLSPPSWWEGGGVDSTSFQSSPAPDPFPIRGSFLAMEMKISRRVKIPRFLNGNGNRPRRDLAMLRLNTSPSLIEQSLVYEGNPYRSDSDQQLSHLGQGGVTVGPPKINARMSTAGHTELQVRKAQRHKRALIHQV